MMELLLERLERPALARVVAGVLDRTRCDKLLRRLGVSSGEESYEARVSRLLDAATDELWRELDRASETERALVSSLLPHEIEERLSSHQALRWPHHGARLSWAVLRDERPECGPVASRIVQSHLEAVGAPDASAPALDVGAVLTALQGDLRAESLAVELERSLRDLRAERQQRVALDDRVQRLLEKPAAPLVGKPDKRSETGQREVAEARGRVAELEAEVQRLKDKMERLRELHASERATWKKSEATVSPLGPAVAPPPRPAENASRAKDGARLGVFLDVANLAGAARRLFSGSIDYQRLLKLVLGDRRLVDARAYAIDKGDGFEGFARALRAAGYRVLGKRPKVFPDGTMKADWDVGLAVDILQVADKLDVVVLGSGDGDLLPLVSALKQRRVRVELISFESRTSSELTKAADVVIELDATVLEPS